MFVDWLLQLKTRTPEAFTPVFDDRDTKYDVLYSQHFKMIKRSSSVPTVKVIDDSEGGGKLILQKQFMQEACKEAYDGIENQEGGPFGCVIADSNGKIIGRGHNRVVKNNDPTAHGEIQAIRDACKYLSTFDLSDCVLYTTSEPCGMCLYACMWANIKTVYYGCTVDDAANIGFRDEKFDKTTNLDRHGLKASGYLSQTCRKMCLKLFEKYQELDHTKY